MEVKIVPECRWITEPFPVGHDHRSTHSSIPFFFFQIFIFSREHSTTFSVPSQTANVSLAYVSRFWYKFFFLSGAWRLYFFFFRLPRVCVWLSVKLNLPTKNKYLFIFPSIYLEFRGEEEKKTHWHAVKRKIYTRSGQVFAIRALLHLPQHRLGIAPAPK